MKKIILSVAILFATIATRAEYLSWCVTQTGYNQATLWAYTGDTWSSSSAHEIDTLTTIPGGMVSDLGTYSGSSYNYYIELYNYNSATGESSDSVNGGSFAYSELANKGVLLSSWTAFANVTTAWNGTKAVATPEPTSGLLLLMGFAMLGLKRKKEV